MSRLFCLSILLATCFSSLQAKEEKAACIDQSVVNEAVDVDKISKAIGHVIARQFDQPGFAFNFAKVIEGMHDARAGIASPMTDSEIEQVLASIQEKIFLKTSEENLAKASQFLESNKSKEGIIALEEKLQYEVIQKGQGEGVAKGATTH